MYKYIKFVAVVVRRAKRGKTFVNESQVVLALLLEWMRKRRESNLSHSTDNDPHANFVQTFK